MLTDYIHAHQAEFWATLGFILLTVEVLVLSMASGILFFLGIGALLTGLLMGLGVLPETWTAGIAGFGVSSIIITALLWKPLKRMQASPVGKREHSSDFIGLEFVIADELTRERAGKHRYSGVEWRVEIDTDAGIDTIPAGATVVVASVDAGKLRVKPKT